MVEHQRTLVAALALALAIPASAQAWWAFNRHEVLPVSEGAYEVVGRVGTSAQDYWCAIGHFARAALGADATQRVYIVEGIGPSVNRSGRKSVKFSLTPPQGVDLTPGLSLSTKRVGDNLNAATAQNYCYDRVEDRIWRP